MKKIFLAAVALSAAFATPSMAFDNEPEPGFSQKAFVGMTIANLRNYAADPKVGYSIGWLGEYMLPGAAGTYVNFGANMSMQGFKEYVFGNYKVSSHYLTVPIHVGYRYDINDKWGAYADFGPYFALGLGANHKFFKDIADGGNDANRFDCGLGFNVGGEYNKKLSLTFGFNWGLTGTIEMPSPASDVKTFNSTITLGYRF